MQRYEVHSHTMFSNLRLLDCINKPKDLINRAIEQGLSGISITDHEALSCHIEVNIYAQELLKTNPNFKIGLGNEIYLVDERENGIKYYHFILIAKDAIGHKQLRKLSSIAWMNSYFDRGMERVPTLKSDLEKIIAEAPGHLIATTACLGGELSTNVLNMESARKIGDTQTAETSKQNIINFVLWCKNIFEEDFYFEVAPAANKEQIIVNKKIAELSKVFNVKMVIGSDAHYLSKEDRYVHKSYLNSKGGEREVDDFYEFSYLQTEEEIKENLAPSIIDLYEEMCNNSMEIYNKIENYSLLHSQQIPKVNVKNYPKLTPSVARPVLDELLGSNDKVERYWVNECLLKLQKKNKFNDEYLDRLEYEADIKKTIGEALNTNMFAYPVTLQHYVDLFWECGSMVGAGRGSSCSGLNHYLLGVTQLDPIEWSLPFWRYLNKERFELGDIDLDLCPSKRPLILQKIKEERGQNFLPEIDDLTRKNCGCTLIATFGTETTKSAIQTACFTKGTLVKVKDGEKSIEDIQKGDLVWTTNGWEEVITPTVTTSENIVEIENRMFLENKILTTGEHEFLIIPMEENHRGRLKGSFNKEKVIEIFPEFSSYKSTEQKYQNGYGYCREVVPIWKKAEDLKVLNTRQKYYGCKRIDTKVIHKNYIEWNNDFLENFGVGISNKIEINDDFCELLGIWLAEGSSNGQQITFTIHQKEEDFKNRIIELMWKVFKIDNFGIYYRKDNLAQNISYSSKQLINFFNQLFKVKSITEINQWNKFIPNDLLYIEPDKQLQIFKGWFMGDGYARVNSNRSAEAKGTTVSRQLAKDMIHILNRNYLNPTIQFEQRSNYHNTKKQKDCYNLMFYSKKAIKLFEMKYKSNLKNKLIFNFEDLGEMDYPCFFENNIYLKTTLRCNGVVDKKQQEVYCLVVPSHNFTVGDTIVHNCRGYRSDDYPDGIDVDTAQYMSALIPQERGFLWSLSDVVNGNKDKGRRPVASFINEVEQYPGLLEIMMGIEGLISRRGSHASGVILFDEDPYEFGCFMRTPSGDVITQYDLHMCEAAGMTKYDFLVTEVQDKLVQAIQFLQEYGEIEKDLTLREVYNKYFHPEILPIEDEKIWEQIDNVNILDLFQFDSDVGSQAAKKIKPRSILELADANGLMRLMTSEDSGEQPIDKYVRFKNNIQLWYDEMNSYGLTKEEQEVLKLHFLKSHGVPPSQEQLMTMLMDEHICAFSLKDANSARKIVGKKQMSKIPALHEQILSSARSPALGKYIWECGVGPQMG